MATKARKDSRGYALKKGESQRKDGRYVFRYTTIRGEQKAVYAKELSELRKKEVKIRRAFPSRSWQTPECSLLPWRSGRSCPRCTAS